MKSLSTLNCGTDIPDIPGKSGTFKRHKCRHLLRTGRTLSKERPLLFQIRVMFVILSAGSNSAKPFKVRCLINIPSISTWRQLLTIYKEVSSVVVILETINVTSFSSLALSTETTNFFSFFRRQIFLWKPFSCFEILTCIEQMFKQTESIHLASAEKEKSCLFKMILRQNDIFHYSLTSWEIP